MINPSSDSGMNAEEFQRPSQTAIPRILTDDNSTDQNCDESGIALHTATRSNDKTVPKTLAQCKWDMMFKKLIEYKSEHGDCLVPNRYQKNPQLGSWVSTQRRQFKSLMAGKDTRLSHDRARMLQSAGFVWATRDPRHVPWEKRFQELLEFKAKRGDCLVPIGYKENTQLSNWVSTQRQEYKLMADGRPTRLTKERIQLLENAGFVWEAQRGGSRKKRARKSIPTEKGWDELVLPGSGCMNSESLPTYRNNIPLGHTEYDAPLQEIHPTKQFILSDNMATDSISSKLPGTFAFNKRESEAHPTTMGHQSHLAVGEMGNSVKGKGAVKASYSIVVGTTESESLLTLPTFKQSKDESSQEQKHHQISDTNLKLNDRGNNRKSEEDGIYDDASDDDEDYVKEFFYRKLSSQRTSHSRTVFPRNLQNEI